MCFQGCRHMCARQLCAVFIQLSLQDTACHCRLSLEVVFTTYFGSWLFWHVLSCRSTKKHTHIYMCAHAVAQTHTVLCNVLTTPSLKIPPVSDDEAYRYYECTIPLPYSKSQPFRIVTLLNISGWAAEAWQYCPPSSLALSVSMYSSPHWTKRDLDSEGWQWSFPWPPRVTLSNNRGGWCLCRDLWSCRRSDFFLCCLLLSCCLQCVLCFKLTAMLGSWWAQSYTVCGWGVHPNTLT